MTDRMPGRMVQPRCPYCRAAPGPDCAGRRRAARRVRRVLARDLHREVVEVLDDRRWASRYPDW